MEWVIIILIVMVYYGLSEQIKKISKTLNVAKKEFPSLKDLFNKNIKIEIIDDDFTEEKIGILVKYDDVWLALETKDKKGNIKQNYFRLSNIKAINILDN